MVTDLISGAFDATVENASPCVVSRNAFTLRDTFHGGAILSLNAFCLLLWPWNKRSADCSLPVPPALEHVFGGLRLACSTGLGTSVLWIAACLFHRPWNKYSVDCSLPVPLAFEQVFCELQLILFEIQHLHLFTMCTTSPYRLLAVTSLTKLLDCQALKKGEEAKTKWQICYWLWVRMS